jgi:hypothetical protein
MHVKAIIEGEVRSLMVHLLDTELRKGEIRREHKVDSSQ